MSVGERVLRWSVWGDPDGPIVLVLPHIGESGTRQPRGFAEAIRDAGVRLVSVARAGFGGSSPFQGEDAESYLGNAMRGLRFLHRWRPISRWLVRETAKAVRKDALGSIKDSIKHTPEIDRPIASDPEHMALGAEEMAEMFADEAVALAEYRILIAPWPVDLSTVRTPVTLWHGAVDKTAPVGMARWLSRRIAGSRLELLQGVGHMYRADVERRILLDTRGDGGNP